MPLVHTQTALFVVVAATLVTPTFFGAGTSLAADPVPDELAFGMDPNGVRFMLGQGGSPDLVQLWVGAWLDRGGWNAIDRALAEAGRANITPVIQFYYWGDDLDDACYHLLCVTADGQAKSQAGWDRLAIQLGEHLRTNLGAATAIIVLETEFNKEVADGEALDAALERQAILLRQAYPEARIALGFGNWNRSSWSQFDRAAAASDELSLQLLRGSTRHDAESYRMAAYSLLEGARTLHELYGKRIIVSDVALSTYGDPRFLQAQAEAIRNLRSLSTELAAAGVYAIVYRSLVDAVGAPPGYFGEAERHFGLAWASNGTLKPGFDAWHRWMIGAAPEGVVGPRILPESRDPTGL